MAETYILRAKYGEALALLLDVKEATAPLAALRRR